MRGEQNCFSEYETKICGKVQRQEDGEDHDFKRFVCNLLFTIKTNRIEACFENILNLGVCKPNDLAVLNQHHLEGRLNST